MELSWSLLEPSGPLVPGPGPWPNGLGLWSNGGWWWSGWLLPPPAKVTLVSLQRTLFGFHTADICSLYSRYADCADWRMPDLVENHGNCFEPGPYGSVWADNCAESLPPALGGLWDASRTPKPPKNPKIPGFRGSGVWGVRAPPIPPIFPV